MKHGEGLHNSLICWFVGHFFNIYFRNYLNYFSQCCFDGVGKEKTLKSIFICQSCQLFIINLSKGL